MIPRYQTDIMGQIWNDHHKYRTWYRVELAYLEAYLAHCGKDEPLIARLREKERSIDWIDFVRRVDAYDGEVRHDVIAFLHALEDEMGDDARLIHIGLTSSDVVDTALALTLKMAGERIAEQLKAAIACLWQKAESFRGVPCLGRTHGQAAEPTTFGIKLLSHLCELTRSYERLAYVIDDIAVGKFSGAVGTYAHSYPEVEKRALAQLGLKAETVATQIVARDRHAAFFGALAVLAGSVERLSIEIRLLMHGQILEVFEPFYAKQKGSSAMPHKKNPILSENLTGLMRLMRSYALASMEDQALWHERDISHSSVERVIGPDATSIMDFALKRLTDLINGLMINEERMKANLQAAGDLLSSQGIMLALVKRGLRRQKAHELVQKAVFYDNNAGFIDKLVDSQISQYLSHKELEEI
jgi:adenylosuccinate lyase